MNKRRDIRNFYIDETFIPVWSEFIKICKREGDSASKKIRDFVTKYVDVHREGNPQLLLDRFGSELTLVCNRCGKGGFKTLHRVEYYTGYIAHACDNCLRMDRQNRLVKKVLGAI